MATHDGRLREALLLALGPVPVEQLLGVRRETLHQLTALEVPTRVYVPYGPDWFRYWLRRVADPAARLTSDPLRPSRSPIPIPDACVMGLA